MRGDLRGEFIAPDGRRPDEMEAMVRLAGSGLEMARPVAGAAMLLGGMSAAPWVFQKGGQVLSATTRGSKVVGTYAYRQGLSAARNLSRKARVHVGRNTGEILGFKMFGPARPPAAYRNALMGKGPGAIRNPARMLPAPTGLQQFRSATRKAGGRVPVSGWAARGAALMARGM